MVRDYIFFHDLPSPVQGDDNYALSLLGIMHGVLAELGIVSD